MRQMFVKFENAWQVRDFVNVLNKMEANFELGSGRRIVDAKSALGVFALDLTQPQKLVCDMDDGVDLDKITPFLYKKYTERRRA